MLKSVNVPSNLQCSELADRAGPPRCADRLIMRVPRSRVHCGQGVLATCANLGDKLSFRLLFQRRMRAAAAAHAANRALGTTYPDLGVEVPLYCCTTKALVPSSFKYEDLSFTFELFQDDSERQERIGYMKHWNEDCREDNPDEEFEEYEDYLSPTVLSNYAAPPHYVNAAANFEENLVWCSTVRGKPGGVYAAAPCTNDRIARRTSVGIDTLMDDYHSEWCRPYRMVVTATRDTDGKMCQIVDVVCRDGQGFKEVGGDTTTGDVSFMVVPADGGDGKDDKLDDDSESESDEDRGLSVYYFFGSNAYNMRIEQQLEEPGSDEKVDKAWDGMMTAAYESLGALFLLSIEWNNNDPLQIAEALGTLEWY